MPYFCFKKEVCAPPAGTLPLASYFPLIILIYTDVSRIRDDPCNPWELFKLTLSKSYTPR